MTPEEISALQYDVMIAIGKLEGLVPLVEGLADTHQRGLGFLTPAARAALDIAVATDRLALRTQPHRPEVGLDWLNRDRDVVPSGHVRAPGTIAAISIEADIHFTLRDLVKRSTRWIYRVHGICVLGTLPAEPAAEQLLTRLRSLALHAHHQQPLNTISREVDRLNDEATFLVDGDDKSLLVDPCPHCGNQTLVVHHREGIIRCGRDQRTGSFAFCRCSDPLCDCRNKPIAFRHEWHSTPAAAGNPRFEWKGLNNLLTARRAANQQGAPA